MNAKLLIEVDVDVKDEFLTKNNITGEEARVMLASMALQRAGDHGNAGEERIRGIFLHDIPGIKVLIVECGNESLVDEEQGVA